MAPAASEETIRHGHRFTGVHRFDGCTGRDGAKQRQFHRSLKQLGGKDLDRTTLVVRALDVALALEIREVLVHRGQRVIVES